MIITNIDGSPYQETGTTLTELVDAVTHISSQRVAELLGDRNGKDALRHSERVIGDFLAHTKIRANLLTGNYQAGLRLVAPIFFDAEGTLSELPYLNILVALLARLKKETNSKYQINQTEGKMSLLDEIVDSFISKNSPSPNDATSILSKFTRKRSLFEKKVA